MLRVNPVGKLVKASPYVSIIDLISAAVPVTISSMLPRFWKAISLIDQVDVSVLTKSVPDNAPIYSSQLN